MALLVDTNIFIDAEQGRLDLASLPVLQNEAVFMAAITVSELLAGVQLAKTKEESLRRQAWVENVIRHVPILDFDREVARIYAELYAHALTQTQRRQLNVHDLQIAATALVYGYIILSRNVGDFKDIPGVQVLDPQAEKGVHEARAIYR